MLAHVTLEINIDHLMQIKNGRRDLLLSKICSMEYYVVLKFDMQKMLQISYFHFESFLLLFTVV